MPILHLFASDIVLSGGNISSQSVTLLTSHWLTSWLNAVVNWNICDMDVTFDVSRRYPG